MPPFDIRTAYLINGMLYLVMPIVAWIVLSGKRNQQLAYWCGGGLLVGIGLAMIAMRGSVPDFISFGVANALVLAGNLGRIHSLQLDLNIRWHLRWMILAAIAFLVVHEGLRLVLDNDAVRYAFGSTSAFLSVTYLAFQARQIAKLEQSLNANLIAGIYLLVAATLLVSVLFNLFSRRNIRYSTPTCP